MAEAYYHAYVEYDPDKTDEQWLFDMYDWLVNELEAMDANTFWAMYGNL